MQGFFDNGTGQETTQLGASGGINWDKALQPPVDEESEKQNIQDAKRRQEQENVLANRHGMVPRVVEKLKLIRPTASFKLKGSTFFIMENENSKLQMRGGMLGHYLYPYCLDRYNLAVPYPVPNQNTTPLLHARGFPGIQLYPSVPDNQPLPNGFFCLEGVHFIKATNPPSYYEIGLDVLKDALEKAEDMDHEFALKIQGYANVSASTVWDCIDPDFDPSDRKQVIDQFMGKYLERFYTPMDPTGEPDTRDVVSEAIYKFKCFCQVNSISFQKIILSHPCVWR